MTYPIMPHGMPPHAQFGPRMMYSPYMNPYVSMPPTPYEQSNAQLYRYREGSNGKMVGAVAGGVGGAILVGGGAALAGAKIGGAAGSVGGPIGIAVGIVVGGLAGLIAGGFLGKAAAEYDAINKDAGDDGKLNGSPMLGAGEYANHQMLGYQGIF